MSTVYIVTHTEATHHVDEIVGGWHDSHLTDRGRRQAQAIASTLQARIDTTPKLFASPLNRTTQTAEAIAAAFGVPIEFDQDLKEASCGVAEGKPQAWLRERFVPLPSSGNRLDHRICEGAETRREVATRVYRFVEELLADPPDTAIVVTHGFAMSFVVFGWLGLPIESLHHARMYATSGGITKVDWDDMGDRHVLSFNETDHLADI